MAVPHCPLRIGALAVVAPLLLSACAANSTLGMDPGAILSTVIANLPRDGRSRSTTTTTSRAPSGPVHRIPASPAATPAAARVLRTGESYLGIRYVWGGNTP